MQLRPLYFRPTPTALHCSDAFFKQLRSCDELQLSSSLRVSTLTRLKSPILSTNRAALRSVKPLSSSPAEVKNKHVLEIEKIFSGPLKFFGLGKKKATTWVDPTTKLEYDIRGAGEFKSKNLPNFKSLLKT